MHVTSFHVRPNIPEPLKALEHVARNLWYSWNFDAILLFNRLDYDAWIESNMNPVRTLNMVSQSRLEEVAEDDSFLAALAEVHEKMTRYLARESSYDSNPVGNPVGNVAYFSMEFGLDKSLPIYSGGLGVLSGDHLKTASDLGLPLVGVGLLYRQGFFRQYLNADGFQQESYPENDWYSMPVRRCVSDDGTPITVKVDLLDRQIAVAVWEVRVGKVPLYLLDTNIPENSDENRAITATLYGGDREVRIRQEIVHGMGGVQALEALGIEPSVYHMNEGHSAFLALERVRLVMNSRGLTFSEALAGVSASNVFTTHTPVPAGNERFSPDLMRKYFSAIAPGLGLEWNDFMALGREHPKDEQEQFCMTVLALKTSFLSNGVSKLHGQVSRSMWKSIWEGVPENEVPIGHVTNGVHSRTWIAHNNLDLLDRYFGPRFYDEPHSLEIWQRMSRISDEELWRTHERRRERLVAFSRDAVRTQLRRRGATASQLAQAEDVLSPYALTISFARRFATYKRATLLFRDPERLLKLLTSQDHPVQLIFAGKAHPHDGGGKELIRTIHHFSSRPEVRSRIVFLEDYDMNMAKYLVSGSDIWVNTPRRPMEASGTSGMKAAMNGVLNVSVLDGWWSEGYDPSLGWPVGNGEMYEDAEHQDAIESEALYDLLEREVIPTFYDRGTDGLPRSWIDMMKSSMESIGQRFSSHRMLMEYIDQYYTPASVQGRIRTGDDYAGARSLAQHMDKLRAAWPDVSVVSSSAAEGTDLSVGDTLDVSATVALGDLAPTDVAVELYYGRLDSRGQIVDGETARMQFTVHDDSNSVFETSVPLESSGQRGFAIRILPDHPLLGGTLVPGLIRWG